MMNYERWMMNEKPQTRRPDVIVHHSWFIDSTLEKELP